MNVKILFFLRKMGLFSTPGLWQGALHLGSLRAADAGTEKNSPLLPYFMALFVLLTPAHLAASPQPGLGKKTYTEERHGASLQYSENFEALASPTPDIVVLLRTRGGGFPTFNITAQGDVLRIEELSDEQLGKRILDDYRTVGIASGRIARIYRESIAGIPSATIEIAYSLNEVSLIAAVTLIPLLDRHLIATYIDGASEFYQRKLLREEIVSTMAIRPANHTAPTLHAAPDGKVPGAWPYLPIAAVVLFVVLVGAPLMARRRR